MAQRQRDGQTEPVLRLVALFVSTIGLVRQHLIYEVDGVWYYLSV